MLLIGNCQVTRFHGRVLRITQGGASMSSYPFAAQRTPQHDPRAYFKVAVSIPPWLEELEAHGLPPLGKGLPGGDGPTHRLLTQKIC